MQQQQEKEVEELSDSVVKKCVLLLHSDYHVGVPPTLRTRSSSVDCKKPMSDWRQLPGFFKRMKMSLPKERARALTVSKESQLSKQVVEFVSSPKGVSELGEQMDSMRNSCVGAIVGLKFIAKLLSGTENISEVAGVLNRVFMSESKKLHYFEGLDGVDSSLKEALTQAFFELYSQLFELFVVKLNRERD